MRFLLIALLTAVFSLPVSALTFKTGQVIGADGQAHDGASPEQQERLKAIARDGGKMAGVWGQNVYIAIEDKMVFVPVRDLAGKGEEKVRSIITANVVKEVTGLDVDTDVLVERLEENLGDVEASLIEAIQQTVNQHRTDNADVNPTGQLGKLINAANQYYDAGLNTGQINDAVEAASNAVSQLPEDMQAVINEIIEAAVKAVESASSDIDAALKTWDSLSDAAKQAIVDEANNSGQLGCGNGYTCTMKDAENYANGLR